MPVIEAYGMTEAAHQMASQPAAAGRAQAGTVGRGAGPEIAILDDGAASCRRARSARSSIRGPNVFAGYEANPEANAAAFIDGWFRTGDEGSLDADGYLRCAGGSRRSSTAAARRSRRSRSTRRCSRHPAVEQAVDVRACRRPRWARRSPQPSCCPEARSATSASCRTSSRQQLAPFKVPRRIVVRRRDPEGADRQGAAHRARRAARGVRQATPCARPPPSYGFLETELIGIWESVLGIPGLGVGDDFFALGGDSILGAEAVARIRDLTGDRDLPLMSIVRAPTPAAMAREIFAEIGRGLGHRPAAGLGDTDTALPRPSRRRRRPCLPRARPPARADQPSYALRARESTTASVQAASLPELAADYVGSRPGGAAARAIHRSVVSAWGARSRSEMASQLDAAGSRPPP